MKFLKQVRGGWTDGTVAYDLAQRAQRSNVLAWVEMRFPAVGNPAKACDFGMVVKKFDGKKVDFTGKRQAHNKGMHPVLASRCANSSHLVQFGVLSSPQIRNVRAAPDKMTNIRKPARRQSQK